MTPVLALGLVWVAVVTVVAWHRRPALRLLALVPRAERRRLSPRARRLLLPVIPGLLALPVAPVLAPVIIGGAWVVDLRRRRGGTRRRIDAVADSLPEAVDLLALGVGPGSPSPSR